MYIPFNIFSGLTPKDAIKCFIIMITLLLSMFALTLMFSNFNDEKIKNKIYVFCSGNNLQLQETTVVSIRDQIFKIKTINKESSYEYWLLDFDGIRIKDAYKIND